MAWINKILYKVNEDAQTIVYNIGTTFDNVLNGEGSTYSLSTLVNSLKRFFEKQSFMHYSTVQPPDNSKYVEWYCLEAESGDNNPFGNTQFWNPNESLV